MVAVKVVRNIKKYVESARIEANILDEIYRKQKETRKNGCLNLYSHFEFDGNFYLMGGFLLKILILQLLFCPPYFYPSISFFLVG